MGIIRNFAEKYVEKRSLNDPNHWIIRLTDSFSRSKSGIQITPETALQTSAVFACVRVLSETIASLPLQIYQKKGDKKSVAEKHYLYPILHDSPNPWQTKFEFIEMLMGHTALRGNAYAYKVVDGLRRIKGFVPLSPARMEVEATGDFDNPKIVYKYRGEGQQMPEEFDADEVWHLKGLSADGFVGLSPLGMARESIGLAQAAEEHGGMFFRNGAQPSLVASTPGKLSETARKNISESLQVATTGSNKHKIILLEQGLDAKSVGMGNRDSQFLETRQFQVQEIARIFRVPCILIGHPDSASTYASAEQFMLSFVTHTIRPWTVRIEQSINKYLLSDADRKAGYYAEFKLDALLRGDTTSRYNAYSSALANMWMTRNEVRALENLDPVEDGDDFENPNTTTSESNSTASAPDTGTESDEEVKSLRTSIARIEGMLSVKPVQQELPLERRIENQNVTVEVKQKEVLAPKRKMAKIIRDEVTGKMIAAEIIEEPAEDTN
jgi:HK97 family phage portal protein